MGVQAALRAFWIRRHYPEARILVALNQHYWRYDLKEQMISAMAFNQMRSHSIALSVMHPGSQVLLYNLLHCSCAKPDSFSAPAQQEYVRGLNYEIYRARVPASAHGVALGRFQLDLRAHDMLFVGFSDPCRNVDEHLPKASQHLGVPPATLLDSEDTVWLLASSWTEVDAFSHQYQASSESLKLLDSPTRPFPEVCHAPVRNPRPAQSGLQSTHLQLELASKILGNVTQKLGQDQVLQRQSSEVLAQVDRLRHSIAPPVRQRETFDVAICAFEFEAWIFELVRALQSWHGLESMSVAIFLDKTPCEEVMSEIMTRIPWVAVRTGMLHCTRTLRESRLAKSKRIVMTRPKDTHLRDSLMLVATRIANLVFEEGQQERGLLVEVPRGNTNMVTYLAHAPFCDHSGDCLLYTSPSPRDRTRSRMPSSA
eukprot:TRINITY_DN50147_c0_g1_i2.p2 TRINITY_DN50147_c0_g1~~TRINITY_DN50147_c0_g1_i2.p2  ORF type:complete len:426 (-),score=40.92 TRINITY_DN50147_c0_g1_i2:46-1323(-)